jgi:hypothetical protein
LDCDIVISRVDRPWGRGVLNTLAFADWVPVLDGGIAIDTFDNGEMRNAAWRSHVLVPRSALPGTQRPTRLAPAT